MSRQVASLLYSTHSVFRREESIPCPPWGEPDLSAAVLPCISSRSETYRPKPHSMTIQSLQENNISAFPPAGTRLDTDIVKGAQALLREFGDKSVFVNTFDMVTPLVCSDVLPFVVRAGLTTSAASGEITTETDAKAFTLRNCVYARLADLLLLRPSLLRRPGPLSNVLTRHHRSY